MAYMSGLTGPEAATRGILYHAGRKVDYTGVVEPIAPYQANTQVNLLSTQIVPITGQSGTLLQTGQQQLDLVLCGPRQQTDIDVVKEWMVRITVTNTSADVVTCNPVWYMFNQLHFVIDTDPVFQYNSGLSTCGRQLENRALTISANRVMGGAGSTGIGGQWPMYGYGAWPPPNLVANFLTIAAHSSYEFQFDLSLLQPWLASLPLLSTSSEILLRLYFTNAASFITSTSAAAPSTNPLTVSRVIIQATGHHLGPESRIEFTNLMRSRMNHWPATYPLYRSWNKQAVGSLAQVAETSYILEGLVMRLYHDFYGDTVSVAEDAIIQLTPFSQAKAKDSIGREFFINMFDVQEWYSMSSSIYGLSIPETVFPLTTPSGGAPGYLAWSYLDGGWLLPFCSELTGGGALAKGVLNDSIRFGSYLFTGSEQWQVNAPVAGWDNLTVCVYADICGDVWLDGPTGKIQYKMIKTY